MSGVSERCDSDSVMLTGPAYSDSDPDHTDTPDISMSHQLLALDAQELVHSHHHGRHLLLGDGSVPVEVVQSEGPAEFLLQGAVQEGGEGHQHVLQHTL